MKDLLNLMIFLPSAFAVLCLVVPTRQIARWVALVASVLTLVISLVIAQAYFNTNRTGPQFESSAMWISAINAHYAVGVDGLSLPLVLLTTGLSVLVVAASWNIEKATKAFMALYLFLLTGMLGVFLATDLFLFYVFFEVSLLPMYFLIGIWGGPNKEYAAIKFFLYTLAGSICLLIVMLGFYFYTPDAAPRGGGPHVWTLISSNPNNLTLQSDAVRALFAKGGVHWGWARAAFWLTFICFAIKIPVAPLHTWLPDAHVEAPTPISMILAGVLLKMGGYALIRITYPILPDAGREFWLAVSCIGVFGILYGAFCAMAQTDWKKLVAYSSVSHMGYVTLGIAVMTPTGLNGAYFEMIGHGITSAMMFFLVGVVYERAHHREINRLGGMWLKFPGYGGWSVVGFFAGMGLPLTCGFVGEFLALLGTFEAAGPGQVGANNAHAVYWIGALAATGVVLTAGYILWMFQRVYLGPMKHEYDHYEPVNSREYFIMATLGLAAIVFGVLPVLVFSMTNNTTANLMQIFHAATSGAARFALGQ